jgi:hypothetical protein
MSMHPSTFRGPLLLGTACFQALVAIFLFARSFGVFGSVPASELGRSILRLAAGWALVGALGVIAFWTMERHSWFSLHPYYQVTLVFTVILVWAGALWMLFARFRYLQNRRIDSGK